MLRVTLDTNVYVSGLNYKGSPYRILELAREGRIKVAVSDQILDEVERTLREKFRWPDHRTEQALRAIRGFSRHITPTEHLDVIKEDPDDNGILACAIAGKSDYLISGDNHLLKLGSFRGMPIVKVVDFLEIAKHGRGRS